MAQRPGVTKKVSLSVNRVDLEMLKERAKRAHGGNLSAVFSEMIARIRREEAMRKAFEWYGESVTLDDGDRARIDRELFGEPRPRRRAKRRS